MIQALLLKADSEKKSKSNTCPNESGRRKDLTEEVIKVKARQLSHNTMKYDDDDDAYATTQKIASVPLWWAPRFLDV